MKISNVRASRPAWYDRNAISRNAAYYSDGTAPHAATERWTYTVPSGKKFNAQIMLSAIARATVATVVAPAAMILYYTPSGGTERVLLPAQCLGNLVQDGQTMPLGASLMALAGDNFRAVTTDISTAGTIAYGSSFQGLEYDA